MSNLPQTVLQRPASRPGVHQAGEALIDQDSSSLGATIAKLCYVVKQPIANNLPDTDVMLKKPINEVFAANLARLMAEQKKTQKSLAAESGVGQTTIGLYLNPGRRLVSASGKAPSAKLTEVEMLACGLNVGVLDLLQDHTAKASSKAKARGAFGEMASLIANRIDKLPDNDVVRMQVFRAIARILEEHEPQSKYPQSRAPSPVAKERRDHA